MKFILGSNPDLSSMNAAEQAWMKRHEAHVQIAISKLSFAERKDTSATLTDDESGCLLNHIRHLEEDVTSIPQQMQLAWMCDREFLRMMKSHIAQIEAKEGAL